MSGVTVKLLGARAVRRLLKDLGSKGTRKALRAGLGKAVAVLRKFIRKEIPSHAKSIKKGVGSKVKVNKDGVSAKVGINVGKKSGKGHVPHGAIYILGTKARKTEKGASRGKMPANDVVKRGTAKGAQLAKREMKQKIRETLRKIAKGR